MGEMAAQLQDESAHREWLRQTMAQADHVLVPKRRVAHVVAVLQACASTHPADLVLRTSVEELAYLLGGDGREF